MRKKKILFCSEATFLNTGYATYTREIMSYLNSTNKYELAELGCYASPEDKRSLSIPWKFYPGAISSEATKEEKEHFASKFSHQFGEYKFPAVCLDFKPDIVCDIRDFWMLEFVERSAYRKYFKWCLMPTVDAEPQALNWIETYLSADACLSYSDWAGELLKKQTNNKINYIGSAPPSAHQAYCSIKDKESCRMNLNFPSGKFKVIGTVMRNQRRKLYPDLFATFRMLLDKANNPNEYLLYCHTSYPDMGWDIPSLLQEYSLSSKVLFTYICKKTNKPFASFFSGPTTISPFTNSLDATLCSVHDGLSYDDLSSVMQTFDLYVQYANSEGFGLPQVEAAAGGVPVASINYSAMQTVIEKLEAISLKPRAFYKEMETGCMRAVPDNEYASDQMLEFLSLPEQVRNSIGFNIKQNFLKHFQWDKSGSMWEKCFDSFEILEEEQTWLSPLKIFQPAPKPDFSRFRDLRDIVKFLIQEVLCKPELTYSFLSKRLTKDIMYGFTTSASSGIYANDSSMVGDGANKKAKFNIDIAYEYMKSLRLLENHHEKIRGEAFGIQ